MKRNLFYLFALIFSMGVFTACGNDDDDNSGIDNGEGLTIENSVVGTFGGKLNITMNGNDLTPDGIDQKVYIAKTGEKQVALLLKNFSFLTFDLEDIEVPCTVTKDKKTFSFSGQVTLSFPKASILGACPITVDGTIVDGNIAVTIGVDVTALKQNVVVVFEGIKMENEELVFNFDEWETIESTTVDSEEQYDLPKGDYGVSNPGMLMINDMIAPPFNITFDYPVTAVVGRSGSGKAAQIRTIHTAVIISGIDLNAEMNGQIPYNTSGSLFTGSFWNNAGEMMTNPLNCTKFGIPVKGKPETFSGYYKYAPSATYYDEKNHVVADKTDECAIYAVVYEEFTINDGKKDIIGWLNGDWKNQDSEDVNKGDRYIGASSRVVMKAALSDGSAKSDWTSFSIPFTMMEGKTYDPSKNYYLAIVCASSAEGDYYKGGDGSVLTVDDFRVAVKF